MRRAAVTATVILVVAAVAALGLWLWPGIRSALAPSPSGTSADGTIPARPPDAFPLTVLYVYDGDTIQARMQHPNAVHENTTVTTANPIRIRLIGVNTPEGTPTPQCWADEARAHLAAMLPEGSTVWAAPDRDTWDDYGRRLFNLWTDDGRFVEHELVTAGDAEAIRIWPNVAHYALLSTAQATAQASGVGQWGACPGQAGE